MIVISGPQSVGARSALVDCRIRPKTDSSMGDGRTRESWGADYGVAGIL